MADSKLSRTDVNALTSCLEYEAGKDPYGTIIIANLYKITRTMRASGTKIKAWLQRIAGDELWDQNDPESLALQREFKNRLQFYLNLITVPPYDPAAKKVQDPWDENSSIDNPASPPHIFFSGW